MPLLLPEAPPRPAAGPVAAEPAPVADGGNVVAFPGAVRRWRSVAAAMGAIAAALIFLESACTQRPVNPPLKEHEANVAYEFEHLERNRGKHDDLVVLAFSGGGTRAAAFSYGVLEALRRIEVTGTSPGYALEKEGTTWKMTAPQRRLPRLRTSCPNRRK